jgi:hypothetical protein
MIMLSATKIRPIESCGKMKTTAFFAYRQLALTLQARISVRYQKGEWGILGTEFDYESKE